MWRAITWRLQARIEKSGWYSNNGCPPMFKKAPNFKVSTMKLVSSNSTGLNSNLLWRISVYGRSKRTDKGGVFKFVRCSVHRRHPCEILGGHSIPGVLCSGRISHTWLQVLIGWLLHNTELVWLGCSIYRLKRELERRGGGGEGSKKAKKRRQRENGENCSRVSWKDIQFKEWRHGDKILIGFSW